MVPMRRTYASRIVNGMSESVVVTARIHSESGTPSVTAVKSRGSKKT